MEDLAENMRRQADPRLADLDPPPPPGLSWASAYDVFIHARDVLTFIVARFLSPIALGEDSRMTVGRRREFLSWLRPVELMIRRLLFIEASALAATLPPPPPPVARPLPRPSAPKTRAYKPPSPDPRDWSAAFKVYENTACSPDDNAPVRAGSRHFAFKRRDEDMCDGRSLAVRLEAALRVVDDITPHIRRLALRIQRTGIRVFERLAAPARCHNGSMRNTLRELAEAMTSILAAEDSS